MASLLYLIVQFIELYKLVLIIYIIGSWLVSFNIINASNKFVYSLMTTLYKICEPSLKIVQRFIPVFGNIDISPIIVFVLLEFLKRIIIEYWPI
tara:strand:+ start:1494 stop:1775 length:282 start_codon:yes stop_codon:yes gene_type:complete